MRCSFRGRSLLPCTFTSARKRPQSASAPRCGRMTSCSGHTGRTVTRWPKVFARTRSWRNCSARWTDAAARAAAYGMPGIVVDGNDVLAVERTARAAVERALRAQGPTLIECKTYRLCGHSRSDACNYRSREEEAQWREKDPLTRLARDLSTQIGAAAEEELERIEREVTQLIDEAVAFAEASPPPQPEDALLDVFWEGR